MISDFKGLGGVNGKEGKVGECWYHEGTKAYFDVFDHYKMIKAMCNYHAMFTQEGWRVKRV